MFARVTTIEGSPERIDESIRLFKETVVPGVSKIKGFKGSYFLVDGKTGKQMGVALDEGYEKEGMMYCCELCATG